MDAATARRILDRPNTWVNLSWDLLLYFDAAVTPKRRRRIAERAFDHPALHGPFPEPEPAGPRGVVDVGPWQLACAIGPMDDTHDWISLDVPAGAIRHAVGREVDIDDSAVDSPWRVALDDALRDIASHVFATEPFDHAVIGCTPWHEAESGWNGRLVRQGDGLRWEPPTQGGRS
jgi:hypothetical protein